MERVRHSCGRELAVTDRFNGIAHIIVFHDPVGKVNNIFECPQCGEALYPRDIGETLFDDEEWERELARRRQERLEAYAEKLLEASEAMFRSLAAYLDHAPVALRSICYGPKDALEQGRTAIALARGSDAIYLEEK